MKTFVFVLTFIFINLTTFTQGNIPKGYEKHVTIVPPDTAAMHIYKVIWPYKHPEQLFVFYSNYKNHKEYLLVVNTHTWKNEKWVQLSEEIGLFKGISHDRNHLIFSDFSSFLFFHKKPYQILDMEANAIQRLSKKQLKEYMSNNVILSPGKISSFGDALLSPDRNYFLASSFFSHLAGQNVDYLAQQEFELVVFKYVGR